HSLWDPLLPAQARPRQRRRSKATPRVNVNHTPTSNRRASAMRTLFAWSEWVENQQPCWLLSEELTSLYLPAAACGTCQVAQPPAPGGARSGTREDSAAAVPLAEVVRDGARVGLGEGRCWPRSPRSGGRRLDRGNPRT